MAEFLHKHVMPSGGDYTSLEACMNANEQDLTGDGWFTVEIDGTWSSADTTAVTIHNYTTTAADYINIYTTAAARHKGVWSASYYILEINTNTKNLTVSTSYTTVDGLQVNNSANPGEVGIYLVGTSSGIVIKNNIIKKGGGVGNYQGITSNIGTVRPNHAIIYNNVIYGWDHGIYGNGDVKVYNNTVYGCNYGLYRNGWQFYFWNNAVMGNDTSDISVTDEYVEDYNMVSDTSVSGTHDLQSKVPANQFTNLTGGSENFHLILGADAIDAGYDYSAIFTDDIDGVTRSGTWDIGADEYVAAGGAVLGMMTPRTNFWGDL